MADWEVLLLRLEILQRAELRWTGWESWGEWDGTVFTSHAAISKKGIGVWITGLLLGFGNMDSLFMNLGFFIVILA